LDPEDVANLSYGTEEETSVHGLCECEALASLRHAYLGSFFLDPEGVTNQSKRAPLTYYQSMGYKGPVLRLRCIGHPRARTQILF